MVVKTCTYIMHAWPEALRKATVIKHIDWQQRYSVDSIQSTGPVCLSEITSHAGYSKPQHGHGSHSNTVSDQQTEQWNKFTLHSRHYAAQTQTPGSQPWNSFYSVKRLEHYNWAKSFTDNRRRKEVLRHESIPWVSWAGPGQKPQEVQDRNALMKSFC